MNNSVARKFSFLLEPRAVLFGFALFTFVWMWVRDARVDWTGASHYHGYFANVVLAFPLLLASLGLLVNRWWSLPIAMFLSGHLIKQLVFQILLSSLYAHDVPMFSSRAFSYWWLVVSELQPQYLVQVALGAAILFYSSALFFRWAYRRVTRNGI
jgi:hypothetical protein